MGYSKRGFTIIELMIAVTVFAAAVTLILAGVIFIARKYQQSSNRIAIEEVSRNVHQQITETIQFSDSTITKKEVGNYKVFCVGSQMYFYGKNNVVDNSSYQSQPEGLFYTANNGCLDSDVNPGAKQNLLSPGSKVVYFDYTNNLFTTVIAKLPADVTNLIDYGAGPADFKCDFTKPGRELCASVKMQSLASPRLE